jgi:D-ribose pyranose/furanose isomerase RbsD
MKPETAGKVKFGVWGLICTPYANILLQSGVAFGTPTPAP